MEDVNARIVIAAESGDSLKSINGVKRGLSEITDSRMRDLKIAQAKSKLELAEYRSAIAAQKAYNAEIKLEGAVKRLNFRRSNGAREKEIQQMEKSVESLRAEYLSLANAEASANLVAYQAKKNLDNLKESLSENSNATASASKNMRQFSTSATVARAAGRLFGIDVSEGVNPALVKQGIIVAGVVSAFNLLKFAYSSYIGKTRENIALLNRNSASLNEVYERNKKLREQQAESLSYLERMQEKERLSNYERFKTSEILKTLGNDYKALGMQIDISTGKIDKFIQANARLSRRQITSETGDLLRRRIAIESERQAIISAIRVKPIVSDVRSKITNGVDPFQNLGLGIFKNISFATQEDKRDLEERTKRLEELRKEYSEINNRLRELKKLNPEAEAAAKLKDRAQAVSRLIEAENKQFEIQRARNRGDEQGAAWMEKRLELQRQINGLTDKELNTYKQAWLARREIMAADRVNELRLSMVQNQQIRALRERGEFKQADWLEYRGQNLQGITGASAYQAWKNWSADYDSRMQYEHRERVKTLKDELRIEQMLLSGDERRARLAKWQNELKQRGITGSMAQRELELREQVYQTREFRKIWDNAINRAKNAPSYRFRSTTQSAVFANSVDALRLQSRVLTQSPEMKVQQSQLDTLKQIKNGIDRLVGPARTAPTMVRS